MNVNQAWRKVKSELKGTNIDDYSKHCFIAGIAYALDLQRINADKSLEKVSKEVEKMIAKSS